MEKVVTINVDEARVRAKAWATPENLAWFDSLTDEDIAAQVVSNPDVAPKLIRTRKAGDSIKRGAGEVN